MDQLQPSVVGQPTKRLASHGADAPSDDLNLAPNVADPFMRLMQQAHPKLRQRALYYTRHADQAEDLLQDTMVRIWTHRDQFAEGSNFLAWANQILTRVFLRRYRRAQQEKRSLAADRRGEIAHNFGAAARCRRPTNPETSLDEGREHQRVRAAISALPAMYAEVIVLCDLEGQSYRDAAQRIGCPLGTIMSRLHRGRAQLRAALAERATAHLRVA